MGLGSASIFKPPTGLLPNEQVIWTRQNRSGIPARALAIMLLFFGGIPLILGLVSGAIVPGAMFFAFVLLITLPLILVSRRAGGTRFYLTTSRLVQTNNNTIIQQVSRSIFKSRPLGQFLQKKLEFSPNAFVDKFSLRVLDPNSGNVIMNLGVMTQPMVQSLESLIGNVYCQYCGRQNDPSSTTCSSCGANI